jgi:hypothetical protein
MLRAAFSVLEVEAHFIAGKEMNCVNTEGSGVANLMFAAPEPIYNTSKFYANFVSWYKHWGAELESSASA